MNPRYDYTNANGLVDGDIPSGSPCAFAETCTVRTERCPTKEKLLPHSFSCALARALSLGRTPRSK